MKNTFITIIALLLALTAGAQQTATPPQDAAIETWTAVFNYHYQDNNGEVSEPTTEQMGVCFSGNDVYFNLPNPITGNTWVKGTFDGTTARFPRQQYIGSYNGSPAYLDALDDSGLSDLVFSYSAGTETFATSQWVLINSSLTANQPWCYYTDMTVSKNGSSVTPEDVVTPPANLQTSEYSFTATSILLNADGSINGQESVGYNVRMGFNGTDCYIQGISDMLPEAWIKGTYSQTDGIVTFPTGQYLGRALYGIYFAGMAYGTRIAADAQLCDVEFKYDAAARTMQAAQYIVISASKTALQPVDLLANAWLRPIENKAAQPAAAEIIAVQPYSAAEGAGFVAFSIPSNDAEGNAILTDLLAYRMYIDSGNGEQIYTFSKQTYQDLPEQQMTIIPLSFVDNYDFKAYGPNIREVYFYNESTAWKRIGIESIYNGGGEQRFAPSITWAALSDDPSGIANTGTAAVVSETVTDLQGRAATPSTRGILIKRQQLADGTTRTTKVVVR